MQNVKSPTSTHLFAVPSFLMGIARTVDLFGLLNEYNTSPNDRLADYYALYSDWKAVGDDMREIMREYKETFK